MEFYAFQLNLSDLLLCISCLFAYLFQLHYTYWPTQSLCHCLLWNVIKNYPESDLQFLRFGIYVVRVSRERQFGKSKYLEAASYEEKKK